MENVAMDRTRRALRFIREEATAFGRWSDIPAGTAGSPLMFPGTTGKTSLSTMRTALASERHAGPRRPAGLISNRILTAVRRMGPAEPEG